MEKSKKTIHPEWAVKCRRPGTELRFIGGHYYLYEVSSVYDKEKKRPRKKTGKLLGKITEMDGFIESEKYRLARLAKKMVAPEAGSVISIREYGLSSFILGEEVRQISEALKEVFPSTWDKILGLAYCRLVYQSPLKNMPYRLQRSWLSNQLKLDDWKERDIALFLRDLGRNRELAVTYMKRFVKEGDFVLADATDILCKSSRITLAKSGYNHHMNYQQQIGLMYLYSAQSRMPAYYRIIPGNLREVKAFKQCIQESGAENVVAIADKGFYSKENAKMLADENIRFIIPLRRNNVLADYSAVEKGTIKSGSNYFLHEERVIWCCEMPSAENRVILFLDERLKVQEESDYIARIKSCPEDHSIEKFHEMKNRFGTIAVDTNIKDASPEKIYSTYKSRMNIEIMFDSLKNVIDADSSYMQDEEALQGWMFINHLALQIYQLIYSRLLENDMLSKHSVSDILMILSDIRKARINGSWLTCEITNKILKVLGKFGFHIT